MVKDCPEPPPPRRLPPVDRYCDGYSIDHLLKDCPVRASISQLSGPKMVLNYIGVIPSPHCDEEEADNRSLKVVTRAQSRVNADSESKQVQTEPVTKKRRSRKARSRRSKNARSQNDSEPNEPINEDIQPEAKRPEPVLSSSESSGGSVIVDKVNETLRAALEAYNERIPPLTELPKKLQEYPNPRGEEKICLAVHQEMVRDTQTTFEGPPPAIRKGPVSLRPSLETIPKVASSQECEGSLSVPAKTESKKVLLRIRHLS